MNPSEWPDIVDAIADGVLVADADDRVAWLNPAAEALTGWSAAEAMGLPWSQVLDFPDGLQALASDVE
jgi:PAS domain S-box-containing protein